MNDGSKKEKRHFKPGLFTFGIVCYRNWEYLKETIDSVLEQDYHAIQLIVSDDGSGNFPIQEFEEYIETHKRDNIVSYIVRESEQNEGTVRHLNRVLECIEGEFFMIMAADDMLDNRGVFSRYVQAFAREGDSCGVVMAQTAMYDITMTNVLEYFVWPDVIAAINEPKAADDLLQQLYYMPCVPTTSTCFRRWVIDQYTPFDTDYFLIEDYPFHIKLAEAGVKMHYENFVSARHRDGGISHGAVTALSQTKRRYYQDCIDSRKKVLESIKEHGSTRERISINKFIISNTDRMLYRTGYGRMGLVRYAYHYPLAFLQELSQRANTGFGAKWCSLLLSMCLVLMYYSEIAQALSSMLPFLPAVLVGRMILFSCGTLLTVCGGFFLLKLVLLGINKVTRFPDDLLV